MPYIPPNRKHNNNKEMAKPVLIVVKKGPLKQIIAIPIEKI